MFHEMCCKAWRIWPADMEFDRCGESAVEIISLFARRVVLIAAVVPTCFVLKDIDGTLDGVIRVSVRLALGADELSQAKQAKRPVHTQAHPYRVSLS